MKADKAKPVAVLLAEQRVNELLCACRVASRFIRIIGVHGKPSARQLVDVCVND